MDAKTQRPRAAVTGGSARREGTLWGGTLYGKHGSYNQGFDSQGGVEFTHPNPANVRAASITEYKNVLIGIRVC